MAREREEQLKMRDEAREWIEQKEIHRCHSRPMINKSSQKMVENRSRAKAHKIDI